MRARSRHSIYLFIFAVLAMADSAEAQSSPEAENAQELTPPPEEALPKVPTELAKGDPVSPPAPPAVSPTADKEIDLDALSKLSLSDILNYKLPGVLTSTRDEAIPASVTVMTEEDIRLTPARNLYDLLEVYVPGTLVMNHHEGPHPGIRGIISDRNYKLLLVVDGKILNMRAHNGATTELENWDLGDIHEIRVIRGPGSVIYGEGAIAGVISIVTKSAQSTGGMGGVYGNAAYNSVGIRTSGSVVTDKYKLFLYASATQTEGITTPRAFIGETSSRSWGQIGVDFPPTSINANPPQTYMGDYHRQPQLKFQGTASFLKEFELRLRYTTSGSALNGSWPKLSPEPGTDPINLYERRQRQAVASLENNHSFSDTFNLRTTLWAATSDYDKGAQTFFAGQPDPENGANRAYAFREDNITLRSVANWRFYQSFEAGFGGEYSHQVFGQGWGDTRARFRMGDGRDIVSGASSEGAVNLGTNVFGTKDTPGTFVGNGWVNNLVALFGEVNLAFDKRFTVLVSGRGDLSNYTRPIFSPRLALVSDNGDVGIFKLIGQLAYRQNTASQLLQQTLLGSRPAPERLVEFEFIYAKQIQKAWQVNLALFYSRLNVVGWNNALFSSSIVGDLALGGAELEVRYTHSSMSFSINHSMTRQFSWQLADGVKSSGISYADYALTTADGVALTGTGNALNNWSNQTTKVVANFKMAPWDQHLTLHFDARGFWDFSGAQNGLLMVERGIAGSPVEAQGNFAIRQIRENGAYLPDVRLNASLIYAPTSTVTLSLYVLNLLGTNGNKRYAYDAGVSGSFPHRAAWVEEPRTVGVSMEYKM